MTWHYKQLRTNKMEKQGLNNVCLNEVESVIIGQHESIMKTAVTKLNPILQNQYYVALMINI